MFVRGTTNKQIEKFEQDFWNRIDVQGPDDCWEWQMGDNGEGYGVIGRKILKCGAQTAHRLSWFLTHGPIPKGKGYHGTCVLHTCDNPPCCNPAHLFLGTMGDNTRDMDSKGRRVTVDARGILNANSKLTEKQVRKIHQEYSAGALQEVLAKKFGISVVTIAEIVSCKRWGHLGLPKASRKRDSRGEKAGMAKLTDKKVRKIRKLHAEGISNPKIAKRYKVTKETIGHIVNRKTWKHVE